MDKYRTPHDTITEVQDMLTLFAKGPYLQRIQELIKELDGIDKDLQPRAGATFILDNGQRVQVGSAAELVQLMHASARTQAADDKGYMLDVADRVRLQHDVTIRTSSAEAFVNDLVRHKMIRTAS